MIRILSPALPPLSPTFAFKSRLARKIEIGAPKEKAPSIMILTLTKRVDWSSNEPEGIIKHYQINPADCPRYGTAFEFNGSLPPMPERCESVWINIDKCDIPYTLPPFPQNARVIVLNCPDLREVPAFPPTLKTLVIWSGAMLHLPPLPTSLKIFKVKGCCDLVFPILPDDLVELQWICTNLADLPELPRHLKKLDCRYNKLVRIHSFPEEIKRIRVNNNQLVHMPSIPAHSDAVITDNPLQSIGRHPQDSVITCNESQASIFEPGYHVYVVEYGEVRQVTRNVQARAAQRVSQFKKELIERAEAPHLIPVMED